MPNLVVFSHIVSEELLATWNLQVTRHSKYQSLEENYKSQKFQSQKIAASLRSRHTCYTKSKELMDALDKVLYFTVCVLH